MRHARTRAVCLLLLALLPVPARAQQPPAPAGAGVLLGTVVSSETAQPLASVSVSVRSLADSAVVAGALTGAGGRFRVEGLRPGRYRVEAALLGYTGHRGAPVTVTAAEPRVEIPEIRLVPSAIALEGVRVTGERSQVVVAPDRNIYSTRDMPVAQGGMATEVLRSVPELEVDIDGAVSLRGTAAQIYLNGRPAPMQGEALNVFLQQFPADRIERVEVIANPSARFQAEGAGGIVNIVLKQNVDLGLSGSTFLNAGTRGDAGAGGRLAYQRGPLTLFGGGFLRHSDRRSTSYDLRQNLLAAPVTLLEQDGWAERQGWSGSVDLTAEWKLGERSTLWSEARLYRNADDEEGVTAYTNAIAASERVLERYDRATLDESLRLSTDLNLGFRHLFEPRQHELEVELEVERGGEDEESRVRRLLFSPEGDPLEVPVELTLDVVDESDRELTLEADYTRTLRGDTRLEVGYQAQHQESDNDRLIEIYPSADAADPRSSLRRGFSHRETFHSAYLTLARAFGPLGVQAGVRAERADTRLELPGDGGAFENDYASIFPNANLTYEVSEGHQLRASYSRRIRRPGPWVLNPINQSSDPLNRRVGNPYIDPQYTHSFSVESSWTESWGTLRVSPYFRRTVHDWAQIKTVDAQGVSTVTWENLASIEQLGTSVTASLRPVRGISGFASLSGYRESRDASNLALDYSGSSLQWSARGNLSGRLTDALSVQGMFFFRPAREVPQGRISSSLMTHVGMRQQFWNDRASLSLMVTDPLDVWRSSFETSDPTHIQIGRSRWSARSATLSFSYSFGRPPRQRQGEGPGEQPAEPEPEIR